MSTAECVCYGECPLAVQLHTQCLLVKPKYATISTRDQHDRRGSETADGLPCNVSGPWHVAFSGNEPHLVECCGLCACVADASCVINRVIKTFMT